MRMTLDRNLYAFSVASDTTAEVEVIAGDLAWSTQTSGPFVAEGRLSRGERAEFTRPAIVQAAGRAEFELTYPQNEPPTLEREPAPSDPVEAGSENLSGDEPTP
jgi:hypothetical protein